MTDTPHDIDASGVRVLSERILRDAKIGSTDAHELAALQYAISDRGNQAAIVLRAAQIIYDFLRETGRSGRADGRTGWIEQIGAEIQGLTGLLVERESELCQVDEEGCAHRFADRQLARPVIEYGPGRSVGGEGRPAAGGEVKE